MKSDGKNSANKSSRLMSIDALRGFDMFWIVGGGALVQALCKAFPNGESFWLFQQFTHVAWSGLHFYDLIFPVFLFIAGLSYPFSHAGQLARGESAWAMHRKVFVRMLTLMALGCVYNGILHFDAHKLATFRYASVLGKIGLAWGIAALIYLHTTWRSRLVWCAAGLVGYMALLTVVAPDAPAGASATSLEGCFVGYLDRRFTPGLLYCNNLLEPSGPFVSFFGFATALFGMAAGDLVRSPRFAPTRKALLLALAGGGSLALGLVVSTFCPIVKMLWTPSFSLIASGCGFLAFAMFYYIVDVRGWQRWCFAFRLIGMNAIAIYMLRKFVNMWQTGQFLFGAVASLAGSFGPAVVSAGIIVLELWILNLLYKNKIFFKT